MIPGALVCGGGDLEQLQDAPQRGAAGVGAATRAAWLGVRVHHCPPVLLVEGGALAQEGREQDQEEGRHGAAAIAGVPAVSLKIWCSVQKYCGGDFRR